GSGASRQPMDPVTLGLCSQIDLDLEVQRAAKEKPVEAEAERGATLLPAEATTAQSRAEAESAKEKPSEELDVGAVLAKLKKIGGKPEGEGEGSSEGGHAA